MSRTGPIIITVTSSLSQDAFIIYVFLRVHSPPTKSPPQLLTLIIRPDTQLTMSGWVHKTRSGIYNLWILIMTSPSPVIKLYNALPAIYWLHLEWEFFAVLACQEMNDATTSIISISIQYYINFNLSQYVKCLYKSKQFKGHNF